jgi:unsaturated rhamnogalacturonyl hydrolase
MANDVGNTELDHLNQLAGKFGIQFNKDSRNRVQGNEYSMGKIVTPPQNVIFKTARQLYLKEISTLSIVSPARAILSDNGYVIMAISKLGKGTVFAVGDPWLYNEYVDGRKLPSEFDNYQAGRDLATWLVQQTPRSSSSHHLR